MLACSSRSARVWRSRRAARARASADRVGRRQPDGCARGDRARLRGGAAAAPVRFNFGGSNVLARQIAAGRPGRSLHQRRRGADGASRRRAGAIDAATRIALLGNRLAVVDAPRRAAAIADCTRADRALHPPDRDRRSGRGAGGVYAQRYLRAAKPVGRRSQSKLVPVGNVRAALAAAASGSVGRGHRLRDGCARCRANVALAFVVTGADAPRIVYPAAVDAADARPRGRGAVPAVPVAARRRPRSSARTGSSRWQAMTLMDVVADHVVHDRDRGAARRC